MWYLSQITNPTGSQLWFSDGRPITERRGGPRTSSRLIIDKQGFVDISDFTPFIETTPRITGVLDLNNRSIPYTSDPASIKLVLPGDGSFSFSLSSASGSMTGRLKPIPQVSSADANFMRRMIAEKYVPYPTVPGVPGKSAEEIRALGKQLFPFSPFSFELAMAVYDWTTASFTRMVLMKIFGYTSIPQNPLPLDSNSIAKMIWESNWGSYVPQNPVYMNSFMMKPAFSLPQVQTQLANVQAKLQHFVNVQNRILTAAFTSMPRTNLQHAPRLFSGQPDIYQLGLGRVPIEFLECPLNVGPPGVELQMAFAEATKTFIRPGRVITTKMVWSFADSIDIAAHYHNGLILIAHPPYGNSRVWEEAAYITPLSNDPKKNEYTFAPGTRFRVLSVRSGSVDGKPVQFLELVVLRRRGRTSALVADDTTAEHEGFDDTANDDLDATNLTDNLDGAGFDAAGVNTVDINPIVTDVAEVEASASESLAEIDAGDIDIGEIQESEIQESDISTADQDSGYMDHAEELNADEVHPLPRPVLSDIPMRRVAYPPYNHYHTHLDGGRRCNCAGGAHE
ncbi:unnamed protein product [Rhizoctonia solani]|uniref:Uncharacterized protein n=1 Tax=Rhizoctonia solani TaxID=456999 RepID=A0A8H2WNA0_9AGAM|nr:unnamed protein product [Rhizoctonia solani]